MQKYLIIILFFLSTSNLFGQCVFDDLFELKIGLSKFKAINVLNLKENVSDLREVYSAWDNFGYLKNDSVFLSQVNYKYKANGCLKNNDNQVILKFADDKLYKIDLKTWFKPDEFKNCVELYNGMLILLGYDFQYSDQFTIKTENSIEQIGEGRFLYKNRDEKSKKKFEKISISYKIEYETVWNNNENKMIKTGKIDRYILEISLINCKETKLDTRGY